MEFEISWERKGRLKGKIEGKREVLGKFIQVQFGEASKGMLEQIARLTDLDLVDRMTDRLFQVANLEDARKIVEEAYSDQQAIG